MTLYIGDNTDNTLIGGAGGDTLQGLDGNDVLIGGGGNDQLDGGEGFDTASYINSVAGLTVNANYTPSSTGDAAGDSFISIEVIQGSNYNDLLEASTQITFLRGGLGADRLSGDFFRTSLLFADYSASTAGLTASIADPSLNTGEAAGDIYYRITGLVGSAFNDTLTGATTDDALRGGVGGDSLDGGAGNDYADYGGASAGLTVSLVNPGMNTGEAAGDTYTSIEGIIGSSFNDTLNGNSSTGGAIGFLQGGAGADALHGGSGFDYAVYSTTAVGMTASLADPWMNTSDAVGDSYDSIEGLVGGAFDDILIGDDGDNYLTGGPGRDTLNGGGGFDIADYSNATSGLYLGPQFISNDAIGDIYISIEGIRGTKFDDLYIGDGSAEYFIGYDGGDLIYGYGGDDTLDGGNGNDRILAGAGNDTVAGGACIDAISGEAGNDTIDGGDGDDTVYGGTGDDVVLGGGGGDELSGNDGNDVVLGQSGSDLINGNYGKDQIDGGDGDDVMYGGDGDDHLVGGDGADQLSGQDGGDVIYGQAGNDLINGGDGNDELSGNEGDDFIYGDDLGGPYDNDLISGNDGADSIFGFGGNDILYGGNGGDSLRGGDGNDTLYGGAGNDYLYGEGGADTFQYQITGFGIDQIFDFTDGQDSLQFHQSVFVNSADVLAHSRQVGADVLMDRGFGDAIALKNFSLGNLGAADMSFYS